MFLKKRITTNKIESILILRENPKNVLATRKRDENEVNIFLSQIIQIRLRKIK